MSSPSAISAQMRPLDIAMLIILSILWGGSFFFFEVLVAVWPPLTVVILRVAIAALFLWMIIFARRLPLPKTRQAWFALLVIGLLNNAIPFFLIAWGQSQPGVTASISSILNATTPFFTVLVAGAVLADERLSGGKLLGVILGAIGVVIMFLPKLQGAGIDVSSIDVSSIDVSSIDASSINAAGSAGQLAILGAAISYAFAGVWARRFKSMGLTPLMVAAGQTAMAALMLLPLTFYFEDPVNAALSAGGSIWLAMLGLALFSTGLAYLLYFRLVANAGATNASLVTLLVPISASVLGVAFLDEIFTIYHGFGMLIIGIGLLVMDGRLFRRSKA